MRNRLIRDGKLKSGVAPSYFIEGMLYNVPADQFVRSRQKKQAAAEAVKRRKQDEADAAAIGAMPKEQHMLGGDYRRGAELARAAL